ncbi:hypothetical protein BD408DRAFT_412571 [Parasitella parasitica]|nr:hypothetical protein BD408DRAFT_412571 [Parasitella parasitica]
MSDFDIASAQNGPSFLESLKRRKALGLDESDQEDEIILKKTKARSKKQKKKSPKLKSNSQQDSKANNTASSMPSLSTPPSPSLEASTNNVNPYLPTDNDLDMTTFIPPKITPNVSQNTKKSTRSTIDDGVIDLSDGDDGDLAADLVIEDLDPDLAALSYSHVRLLAQPKKIVVKLQYIHNFNFENLSNSSKETMQFLEKPVKFKVMDNTEFRILLSNFCTNKQYLRMQDMYLTFNGDIVFLSGTPASVDMSPIGTNKMEVYVKKCYDNMLAEREEQRQKERMKHLQTAENEDEDDFILNTAESPSPGTDAVAEEKRIRLNLRTGNSKVVPFRAKHTTKLRELMEAFKQKAEVSGDVQLSFEGETLDLDQAIEDTDLEDQDIVEVITK